ncbi:DUF3817 domain-containing protein [Catenulispora pinisilvae]|uniref:DUF3817 domain-containing protein n=1 Tax=Catenulispora pinisilvae TaxID=2705253 RepID=UPI002B27BF2B|nr:DUF3817 domain-containing protein [Catenulispora pinisilvae]
MTVPTGFFRIAACAELVTLVVLLANLATLRLAPVSSLIGPTHGCAYLVIVVTTWRNDRAVAGTKVASLLPGIGGILVLRRLASAAEQSQNLA